MRNSFLVLLLVASQLLSGCDRSPETVVPQEEQLGDNLCNIAPPASVVSDHSIATQLGLDLSKLAKLGVSGNLGATLNDKVNTLFQAIPDGDAACQMLLQTISCASAMKNDQVVAALTPQVQNSCQGKRTINSPERAKVLERINALNLDIADGNKILPVLTAKSEAAAANWNKAKSRIETATDESEKTKLSASAENAAEIYWGAFRNEEHVRNEIRKRELEIASLRAKID